MNDLFDPVVAKETKHRIAHLGPHSERQWGTMTVAQALAHCTSAIEMALGVLKPKRSPFPAGIIGPLLTPLFLRIDRPFRPNSNTAPELLPPVATECELECERAKLIASIDNFVCQRVEKPSQAAHPFFGKLDPHQWAVLMYKHLDHHLRQFNV